MAKGLYQKWTTNEGQALLRGWKRAGMSNADIAKKIGVAAGTLDNWATQHDEIRDALKKGKELCDFEAEEALMSLFKGHIVEDVWQDVEELPNGTVKKHKKIVRKWVEPSATAIIFYLKSRAGWREQGQEDQTDVLNRLTDMISSVEKQAHDRFKTE